MFKTLIRAYPDSGYACVVDTRTDTVIARYALDIAGLALADQAVSILNQAVAAKE